MKTPVARKIPKILEKHGHQRVDDYYWLNERENPEVIAYLKAENLYCEQVLSPLNHLENQIFEEIKGRIREDDMSVPYRLRGFWYYTRYEAGKEYPLYCRKPVNGGEEQIMLDGNAMAEGLSYLELTGLSISPNNRFLAYGMDSLGRRKYLLRVLDLQTMQHLPDSVENTDGNYVWAADSHSIFFDVKDEQTLRPWQIRKFVPGQAPPLPVYTENDETFYCQVYTSKDGKFIFFASHSTTTSEISFIPSDQPDATPLVIAPRQRDLLYEAEHHNGFFILRTNLEASNFCLMQAPLRSSSPQEWQTLIPHRKDVLLEDFDVFSNALFTQERLNAQTFIVHRHWQNPQIEKTLDFPDSVYTVAPHYNPEYDTDTYRLTYSSLRMPSSVYAYHLGNGECELLKQQEVVGGYDPELYITERHWVQAEDGVRIPLSLVYRRNREPGGPALLYGYGSYGISLDPQFSVARLSLLDRGWAFAIAHVRGGEEMGRNWYEQGKLAQKENTFKDFIACAQYMLDQGIAGKNKLSAMGGSAGGMLMGVVANRAPELFHSIVAQVPFVDVLTTMLDPNLPLTTGEYDEWGNPEEEEVYFRLLNYSPYDQVKVQDYPHMLVTTGLHDSQVQYWEPAKWVAKLRMLKTDNNYLLLHTDMESGHGGKSGRYARIKEIAREYAFLIGI